MLTEGNGPYALIEERLIRRGCIRYASDQHNNIEYQHI